MRSFAIRSIRARANLSDSDTLFRGYLGVLRRLDRVLPLCSDSYPEDAQPHVGEFRLPLGPAPETAARRWPSFLAPAVPRHVPRCPLENLTNEACMANSDPAVRA